MYNQYNVQQNPVTVGINNTDHLNTIHNSAWKPEHSYFIFHINLTALEYIQKLIYKMAP